MKFKCNRQELLKHVLWVEKAISLKTAMPILSNIYLEIDEDKLHIRGQDLEIGIESTMTVNSETDKKHAFLVQSSLFVNVISKIPDEIIQLELVDEKKIIVSANKLKFDLFGLTVNDYPDFPQHETHINSFEIPADELSGAIKRTIFAVSTDETKTFLNGILLKTSSKGLSFVATDGFRLAYYLSNRESKLEELSIIIPHKAVVELLKIIQQFDPNENLEIGISDNQISIKKNSFVFFSRLIQGKFPDYNQVLPKSTSYSFTINRSQFLSAAERAVVIAEHSNKIVKLIFSSDKLTLLSQAASMGKYEESIEYAQTYSCEEKQLSFNIKLIIECLKVIQSDKVVLKFNNEVSPFVIESELGEEEGVYVVMPIRTSETQVKTNTEASVPV